VSSVQDVPILLGSLDDHKSLLHIAEQTKVLISTAGPYMQMGTPVVDACVKAGCHYTDLTGTTPASNSIVTQLLTVEGVGIQLVEICSVSQKWELLCPELFTHFLELFHAFSRCLL
jgi:short subunit dehydrogenase-like uncharacterized protein